MQCQFCIPACSPPSGQIRYGTLVKTVAASLFLNFPLFFSAPSLQASTQLTSPLASPTQSPTPSPSGSVNSICPGLGPLPLISQFPRPGGPTQGRIKELARRLTAALTLIFILLFTSVMLYLCTHIIAHFFRISCR